MVFRVVNPEKQNSPKFHEPWLALSNAVTFVARKYSYRVGISYIRESP
jgi:hypothetical protein